MDKDNKINNDLDVVLKIYPTRYKNKRGSYIGKYTVDLQSDNPPVGLFEQVDFYLNSLFKNLVNDMKKLDDKTKLEPNKIVPVIVKKIKLEPTKYNKTPMIPEQPNKSNGGNHGGNHRGNHRVIKTRNNKKNRNRRNKNKTQKLI
jgi:hypothetical protein